MHLTFAKREIIGETHLHTHFFRGAALTYKSSRMNLPFCFAGASARWGPTSSSPMPMRFPGMIPTEHGRSLGEMNPRPGSATPSDLGVHDQMANTSHHLQQYRGLKANPMQQGMIPTAHTGAKTASLHRISSGRLLQQLGLMIPKP